MPTFCQMNGVTVGPAPRRYYRTKSCPDYKVDLWHLQCSMNNHRDWCTRLDLTAIQRLRHYLQNHTLLCFVFHVLDLNVNQVVLCIRMQHVAAELCQQPMLMTIIVLNATHNFHGLTSFESMTG